MQRSVDGHEFNDAALVFAKEDNRDLNIEHNYTEDVNKIKSKIIYYRLKIVDKKGKSTYSGAVNVRNVMPVFFTNLKSLTNEIASK